MKHKRSLWLIAIVLINFLIYFKLMINDPLLNYDDTLLIDFLHLLPTLKSYLQKLYIFQLIDVQPVRDLSYVIDFFLKKNIHFWSFHLTNFILWIGIIFTFIRIAEVLFKKSSMILNLALLFSIHPITANTVSWVAARKHLLCAFFTSLATLCLLLIKEYPENKKKFLIISIPILYLMAILSQPIFIFWPTWVLLYFFLFKDSGLQRKQKTFMIVPLLIMMTIGLIANQHYYSGPYVMESRLPKMSIFDISWALNALGRYVYNIFIPTHISVVYYEGSIINLIGLILLPIIVWVILKLMDTRTAILWLAYASFPIILVIGRQANVFVSDTYCIFSLWALYIMLLALIQKLPDISNFSQHQKKIQFALTTLIFSFFFFKSYNTAASYQSTASLWHHANLIEKTPVGLNAEVYSEIQIGNFSKAFEVAVDMFKIFPDSPLLPFTIPHATYFFDRWSIKQKIDFLESTQMKSPWVNYYLACLYEGLKDYTKAYDLLFPMIPSALTFTGAMESVAADLTHFCKKAQKGNCDKIESLFIKAIGSIPWDHDGYQAKLESFK